MERLIRYGVIVREYSYNTINGMTVGSTKVTIVDIE